MSDNRKPVMLIILDGWGVAPHSEGNGVSLAKTSNINKYIESYPAMTLLASGEAVGLSWGEMGNSEVGHLNLGVGKIFYQNLPRIDKDIDGGGFFENAAFLEAFDHVKKHNSKLHLVGLVSEGKVHAMNSHCYALLDLAKRNKVKDVFVHAFLDGRDSPYNSGKGFIEDLQKEIKKIGVGKIASLHGRYYAMDRDNRWDRVEKTWKVLTDGESEEYYKDPVKAIEKSYEEKVYDEEFIPVVIGKEGSPRAVVGDNDAVIFFNYRADRARQLTHTFLDEEFDKFDRGKKIDNLLFVTMTQYEEGLPVKVAYQKETIKTSLPRVLSEKGFRQLHIAETEKYAHVTFFFSGGTEDAFEGEDRIVVPSPKVASYSEQPLMSARSVTDKLIQELNREKHDFVVVNFANPDMVGHTGEIKETVTAIEYIDQCVGEVVELLLSKGGKAVITADHGNAEELLNLQTGERDKEHSTNPVPCIVIDRELEGKNILNNTESGVDLSLLQPVGVLSDIAPTILKLMGIEPPDEMSGRPLV